MVVFRDRVHVNWSFRGGCWVTSDLRVQDPELETCRALEVACTGVCRCIDEGDSWRFLWGYQKNRFWRIPDRVQKSGRWCLQWRCLKRGWALGFMLWWLPTKMLFPELSLTQLSVPCPTGFTLVFPLCTPQAALISPNCSWPWPLGLPCRIPGHGYNLCPNGSRESPYHRGHLSHGHDKTKRQLCHWKATSMAGLGLRGSNPHSILSVPYYGLTLLCLLHGYCICAFILSQLSYQLYAPLCDVHGSIPILLIWTATIFTYTFWLHVQ